MSTRDDIWRCAQGYRNKSENGLEQRFARFIFVPYEDLTQKEINALSDTDRRILNKQFMKDKGEVFSVIYDKVKEEIGEVEIRDEGKYILIRPLTEDINESVD